MKAAAAQKLLDRIESSIVLDSGDKLVLVSSMIFVGEILKQPNPVALELMSVCIDRAKNCLGNADNKIVQ